jgi:hypothetical protein
VVCAKLSHKHKRGLVEKMNVLRGVQGREAGEEAFEGVLKYVKERNLAAFEALEARRDVILAFHRLDVPSSLNVTFLSTNHIENVMGNARGMIGRICRWHDETNQSGALDGSGPAAGAERLQAGARSPAARRVVRRAGSSAGDLKGWLAAPAGRARDHRRSDELWGPFSLSEPRSRPASKVP